MRTDRSRVVLQDGEDVGGQRALWLLGFILTNTLMATLIKLAWRGATL
jgi:hypothetical protein